MKKITIKNKAVAIFCFLFVKVGLLHAQFSHPGIHHKKSDLERAKYAIKAGQEPWLSSFDNLQADPLSSYNYVVQGNPSMTEVSRGVLNDKEYESDMQAAYLNALMYWFTDDQRHADKAIEILNTWSNLTYVGGIPLNVGLYGSPMINAAELIKHSDAGWAEEDMQKFSDMLVHPGYSNTTIPQADIDADNYTFYWGVYNGDPKRAGNQELAAYKTMIAIGIFLDNEIIYDRAVRYLSGFPHRIDDLPYESGPKRSTTVITENEYRISYNWEQDYTIPDYGYDGVITNYIYENGQAQESARDQVHALYGVALTAQIAEIAWNQGDDLYSHADYRILKGLEYGAKYNLSYLQSYPDQTSPWEPTVESGEFVQTYSRTARTFNKKICPYYDTNVERLSRGVNIDRPYWEQPLQHYKNRLNLDENDFLWTQRTRNYNITTSGKYEVRSESATDSPGWGALNFGRVENSPGDPISGFDADGVPVYQMSVLPMTIEAENYDYFVIKGEGKTYHDVSENNQGGFYRTDESVDIKEISEGGFSITYIEDQEWLSYTIYVPADGTYDISINYAAANANGKIKFNIGGVDVTTDVSVPFGAPNSTGITDWKDFTVASNVNLTKGVQNLKVMFSGASNAFELNSFALNINTFSCADPVTEFTNFKSGVQYSYFEGSWSQLPNFNSETPIKSGETTNIGLTEATSIDNYGFVFEGYVRVPNTGDYTFYLNSDDGASLSIEEIELINNDGLHEAREQSASICLNQGYYKIKVEYFTASGANSVLDVWYEGPGISKTTLPCYVAEVMGPGQFEFLFDSEGQFEGWGGFNNPSSTSMEVTSGELQASYLSTNGYFGIQYPADLEFSVNHPYVAIKIDHLPASRMSFYMASGWYNNDKGGFSSLKNETLNHAGIYVYDLSTNGPGFGSAGTQVFASGENYIDTNRVIFLIDDGNTSSSTNATYNDIEWIKNFASLEDIAAYAGLTLGVEGSIKNQVSIYPNPVKDSFTITNSIGSEVKIYNLVGELLTKTAVNNNQQQIDVSKFNEGIYFVCISNNGIVETRKIIKQ